MSASHLLKERRSGTFVIFGSGLFGHGFGFWTPSEVGKRHRRARWSLSPEADAHLHQCIGQCALRRPASVVIEDEVNFGLDVAQGHLHGITEFAHWGFLHDAAARRSTSRIQDALER
jgi:hypothetical protein